MVPLGVTTSPATSTAIPAPTCQEVSPKFLPSQCRSLPHPCPTHLPPWFYHLLLLSFQTRVGGSCCLLFAYLWVPSPSSIHFFFFFWPHLEACGILVPHWGVEPRSLAVKTWSPNHWALREVIFFIFRFFFFLEAVHFLNYSKHDVSFSILIPLWKNLSFLSCCHSSAVFLYVLDDSVWGGKVALFWLWSLPWNLRSFPSLISLIFVETWPKSALWLWPRISPALPFPPEHTLLSRFLMSYHLNNLLTNLPLAY